MAVGCMVEYVVFMKIGICKDPIKIIDISQSQKKIEEWLVLVHLCTLPFLYTHIQ